MEIIFDPITYGAAKSAANSYTDSKVDALKDGLKYKGSVATVSDLPPASSSNKGWMYTITANGHEYVSDGTQWVDLSADLANKVDEAPSDNKEYARKNGAWTEVTGGSGNIFIAEYNVTTASEVAAARTAGKAVFLMYAPSSAMSHQLMLVDESDSKYVFAENTITTNDGVSAFDGVAIALNKQTSEYQVVTASGAIYSKPATGIPDSDLEEAHYTEAEADALINAKYTKPSGGIPKTDLTSAVQTSLGLADTSEQKSRMVTSVDEDSDDAHYPSAKAVYDATGVFAVNANPNMSNYGTCTGTGVYRKGQQCTVVATAESGYSFVKWKITGTTTEVSTSASYTFTVNENVNLTAVFKDDSLQTVAFATGTDAQIAAMVDAADNGIIDLADYWAVGDTRAVTLDAMAADSTKGYEAHVSQEVELVLMDVTCTGINLVSTGSKPSFIVGLKNGLLETGQMNSNSTNAGGWGACKRRGWCNDVFRLAIPSAIRSIFKQFRWQYVTSGTDGTLLTADDYFALPPERAIFPSRTYSREEEWTLFNQWAYYQTASNRIKKAGASGSASYWWGCSPTSGISSRFCVVTGNGSADWPYANSSLLLAPFGCI